MRVSTANENFLSGIEDSNELQDFCLSRFGHTVKRLGTGTRSASDETTEHLTALPAFKDDWDSETFNGKVHVYFTIASGVFNTETDNYQCSYYDHIFSLMVRFDTSVAASDIYDFIDQLKICIRKINVTGDEPRYRGINTEFIFLENSFPAVSCEIMAEIRLSNINDEVTT